METRTIPTGIAGLDLLLGGGIRVLRRGEDLDESATILLRGPPGSGKTVLGMQLAGALARALNADVAYGCVELLPTELAAQHTGLKRKHVAEQMVLAEVGEPGSSAHFPPLPQNPGECRIYAGTLDIGDENDEQDRLVPALLGLLDEVGLSGGRKRVLVVDSLSDGYHLGREAPRRLADDLCKLALERGMVLVLLEETIDDRPSVWSFATDVVIELAAPRDGEQEPTAHVERLISVRKNRFGPALQGRHRFEILEGSGVQVSPQTWAYQPERIESLFFSRWTSTRTQRQTWLESSKDPSDWPEFRHCITSIHSHIQWISLKTALKLGATIRAPDIVLDFSRNNDSNPDKHEEIRIECHDPFLSGSHIIEKTTEAIVHCTRLRHQDSIRRILVGDLKVLRGFRDPEDISRALAMIASLSRRLCIPTLFFTTERSPADARNSPINDITDISADVRCDSTKRILNLSLTELRTGRHTQMTFQY